jgi:hypothetical protein
MTQRIQEFLIAFERLAQTIGCRELCIDERRSRAMMKISVISPDESTTIIDRIQETIDRIQETCENTQGFSWTPSDTGLLYGGKFTYEGHLSEHGLMADIRIGSNIHITDDTPSPISAAMAAAKEFEPSSIYAAATRRCTLVQITSEHLPLGPIRLYEQRTGEPVFVEVTQHPGLWTQWHQTWLR